LDNVYSIGFRLCRQNFHMSLNQFGMSLGCYEGLHDAPDIDQFSNNIEDGSVFWNWHTQGPTWRSRISKSGQFTFFILCYLHRLISHIIRGRKESNKVVIWRYLFHLWSIMTGTPINITISFTSYIDHIYTQRRDALFGLPYITSLTKNLGLLRDDMDLEVIVQMIPLNFSTLMKMDLIQKVKANHYVLEGVEVEKE
jgi:hypothetical protein